MRRFGMTPVRFSKGMQGLILVLSFLALTDAHIVTAAAGGQEIVEATCGAALPVLKHDMSTLASASLEPTLSVLHNLESFLPPATIYPHSSLARHVVLSGHTMQDKLHHFVHVFLF
jgi:hypothetical protein